MELDLPNDLRRASLKPDGLMAAAEKAGAWIWAGVALTLAARLGLRLWVERVPLNFAATRVPPGRLRRSLHAWTLALLSAATAGLMVEAVYLGLVWTAPLPESVTPLLSGLAVLMVLTWAVARLTGQVKASLLPLLLGIVAFGSFTLQQRPGWQWYWERPIFWLCGSTTGRHGCWARRRTLKGLPKRCLASPAHRYAKAANRLPSYCPG